MTSIHEIPGKYEGSIIKPFNYKGFIVEVRPPRWEQKIWIGTLETLEHARYVADAVYYYVGKPPSHLEEGVMTLPAITCIGTMIGTPVELASREMCANYVREIAKGQDFKPQRDDFILKVKDVVKHLDFPFLAPPRTEVVVLDNDDSDREDELLFDEVIIEPLSPMFDIASGSISKRSMGTTSWSYKGVSREANEWVAEIWVPEGNKGNKGMRIRLGEYSSPLQAAFAYDAAVMCLGGGESMLNFHHPIYEQIPRILPDLSPWFFELECRSVVRKFWKLANSEAGNSVPMTLVGEPKDDTNIGGNSQGVPRTFQKCPDLCPKCGKTFLVSQSMFHHLMDHWENKKFSPLLLSSLDSGEDSEFQGVHSRWWLMYKGVQYRKMHELEVDAIGAMATQYGKELPSHVHDKWTAWTWLPQVHEILLGLYSNTLEAAYAYDVAVTCLGGKPLLNFSGHPIYELIPRISRDLPWQAIATKLKEVVKEFGKLVMEGGYYGRPNREMTLMEFLDTSPVKKSKQEEDIFPNSSTQQASDLDTFQKNKRWRLSDTSCSSADFLIAPMTLYHSDDETLLVDISEAHKEMEMLPPHPCVDISKACLTTEPTNTRNKQPYQLVSPGHEGALKFTMADLNIITGNFSESLAVEQQGSGLVYRGQLKDGTMVAIKRINKNEENVMEIEDAGDFQIEVDTLCKKKHVNLVRVLGFLEDENELILVMEYVANGNLRQHLDGVLYGATLDMSKRCRISLDVVAALRHIHNQTKDDLKIIHRDIKSSDVLITDDFCAKVAGYGLSRRNLFGDVGASSSSILVTETSRYMAQEHLIAHQLKEPNDVYSFGELLVEIFTGKCHVESSLPSDECFTSRWVLKQCAEGRLMDIIDPKITPTTFDLKILEQIFKLAASCLALEENNRPTVGDIFGNLSFIVGHYFEDLKVESTSKGNKYEVQEEQKLDLEAGIEPKIQTLHLEELEALKRQEPTHHLDKMDFANPFFMPTKPHGNLFVEGFESNTVQTSIQLGTKLEVNSQQATRQASKVLIGEQNQSSPLFIDIIPDLFQLKSDETYIEMLQEEVAKLGYVSRLLSQGDECEQNLTNIGKTSFFLYFNEKDNVFEFYFKNYHGMASIVGVGLEHAKVVLEDGWRVTVQEISKPNWDDAWMKSDSSSSTMKVTIPEPLEEGMSNMEDSQEALASIPRGQSLLLDLAQYFILNKAIASFLPRASMTHANTDSGTSSSSSNQDIARSSSSSDEKFSSLLQSVRNIFSSREASNQLKTKNGNDPPVDPLGDDDVKIDTTVHLKLLPGGCLYDGSNLLDATILDDKELEELTSQLDNTICLEMIFKFLNEDGKKEILVIVGPISFQFQEENEDTYETTGRFGWYHKLLEVSFGPVNAHCSDIGHNHNALDIIDWKMSKTIGSSNATTRGTSNSMNGGVQGSIPHILTLSGSGSLGWSSSICESFNVGDSLEKPSQMTIGGFEIFPKRYQLSSTLKYAFRAPDHNFQIDLGKLPDEDYRKLHLNLLPMCSPQDVKFEGTWFPKDLEYNQEVLAEYSLITSRLVQMTSKEISERVVKKSWIQRCRRLKIQKETNEPLNYTQKYTRSFFLNQAMTHLNGKKFEVEEILHQRPLNQGEPETHLKECSCYAPQWHANPLLRLNSELNYQP